MRTTIFKQLYFFFFLAGSLCLTACLGEELDLNNLSEDIVLGGTYDTPVLTQTTFRIDSLLKRLDQSDSEATIAINDEGLVALFFTPEPESWNMEEINADFSSFSSDMAGLAIPDLFAGNELASWMINTLGAGIVPVGTNEQKDFFFSLAGAFDVPTARKLTHIDLRREQITLRINTTDLDIQTDNLLKLTLQFPQYNSSSTKTLTTFLNKGTGVTTVFFDEPFDLDCAKDIIASLEITGDGQTTVTADSKISMNITFAPQEYTAYGWFNLVIPGEQKAIDVDADLNKYLADGSTLIFADPKLKFKVNSTIGTPLIMKINTLEALYKDNTSRKIENVWFEINPSTTTPLTLNKETFANRPADQAAFTNLFSTDLVRLFVDYNLETPHIADMENPGLAIQNISSNAGIDMYEDVELPFSLNEGSILLYTDTLNADLSTDLKPEDVNATVALYLDYENDLPMDVGIKIYRLDENEQKLSNTPWEFNLPADSKGIAEPAPLDAKDYLNIRYLAIEYSSGKFTTLKSVSGDDKVQLKIGAKIKGNIKVNNL